MNRKEYIELAIAAGTLWGTSYSWKPPSGAENEPVRHT